MPAPHPHRTRSAPALIVCKNNLLSALPRARTHHRTTVNTCETHGGAALADIDRQQLRAGYIARVRERAIGYVRRLEATAGGAGDAACLRDSVVLRIAAVGVHTHGRFVRRFPLSPLLTPLLAMVFLHSRTRGGGGVVVGGRDSRALQSCPSSVVCQSAECRAIEASFFFVAHADHARGREHAQGRAVGTYHCTTVPLSPSWASTRATSAAQARSLLVVATMVLFLNGVAHWILL